MADKFSTSKRSAIMAKVSAKDTKPEIDVRKALFALGYRFRKNDKRYCGKPDIVLPKYKAIIFIHGCFWHGHKDCKHSVLPKSNLDYWSVKIKKNTMRDEKNEISLKIDGWKVITIWTCEIDTVHKFNDRILLLGQQIL